MKNIPYLLLILVLACSTPKQETQTVIEDPLPSWNEGTAKASIIDYVKQVTDSEGADFVKEGARIAVFDNDGTLWTEQPLYFQLFFTLDRIRELAPQNPEWQEKEPFKSAIAGDMKGVLAHGEEGLIEMVLETHAGLSLSEFSLIVKNWISTARHPKTDKLFTQMVYQPMLEVLDYLRANGFNIYIVSGGGIEFMRPWTEAVYGIPAEQVIGSQMKMTFVNENDTPKIMVEPKLAFINDKAGKPVGIQKHIGKKPIAAFGNSDGDLQMLQWTDSNDLPSFQLYVHHTDSVREWAYDSLSHIGKLKQGLAEGKAKGWTIVDMSKDWKVVYPFELED